MHYAELIEAVEGLKLLPVREGVRSNHWFYALHCDGEKFERDRMITYLAENKIQSRPIWGLIHEQKPYEGSFAYQIEKAKEYWQHVVNIPCSTNLKGEDVEYVVANIKQYEISQ